MEFIYGLLQKKRNEVGAVRENPYPLKTRFSSVYYFGFYSLSRI